MQQLPLSSSTMTLEPQRLETESGHLPSSRELKHMDAIGESGHTGSRLLYPSSPGAMGPVFPKRHFRAVLLLVLLHMGHMASAGRRSHYVHWNTTNPIFRIDNTDHIIDVNSDNQPWEYDQVNIICPRYAVGTRTDEVETFIIYNVSKEEYDSCRITDPNPRVVAMCNKPSQLMYFTLTFRSFTPTPGGMEFHPGRDYYFISTSTKGDLYRKIGGHCSTHNMKVHFKVADNQHETPPEAAGTRRHGGVAVNIPRRARPRPLPPSSTEAAAPPTNRPRRLQGDGRRRPHLEDNKLPRYYGDLSYYPYDGDTTSEQEKTIRYEIETNEIAKHEASRIMAASSSSSATSGQSTFVHLVVAFLLCAWVCSLRTFATVG